MTPVPPASPQPNTLGTGLMGLILSLIGVSLFFGILGSFQGA